MPIDSAKFLMATKIIQQEAPDQKGVFALYDEDEQVVYIGFAVDSIRKHLLSIKKDKTEPCKRQAWYFNFEVTDFPIKRERQLLINYLRKTKHLPKCNQLEQEIK